MRDMLTWMHQNTNDESKEFVNYVAESLHKMTRREQRTTSAYRQSSSMYERWNPIIKDSLIKVLEAKAISHRWCFIRAIL